MREPTQRFWDVMIIKSWQNFDSCQKLNAWAFAEFGKYPQELGLKRTKNCYGHRGQGVRVWVAEYMPILSAKLFALPKERHLEILDWLGKSNTDSLTTKGSKTKNYYNEAINAAKVANRRAVQKTWSDNLEKSLNRNNRWTTVK